MNRKIAAAIIAASVVRSLIPNPAIAEDNSAPGTPAFCDSVLLGAIKGALPVGEWGEFVNKVAATSKTSVATIIKEATGAAEANSAVELGESILSNAGAAKLLLDAIYANLVALGIRINFVTPNNQIAHYGPSDHPTALGEAGKSLRFTVAVTMNMKLPEEALSCLELAGYKFPKTGPIQDVPVLWSPELGSKSLERYGTVEYQPANQKTGSDGTSTLVFTPNSEVGPTNGAVGIWGISGIGKELNVTGTLLANPLVISALGEASPLKAGYVSQLFWGVTTDWTVAYHQARGFRFTEIQFQTRRQDDYVTDWSISGHICGPSPWGLWTIEQKLRSTFKGRSLPGGGSGSFLQEMKQSQNGATWNIGSGGTITFLIQPRYPPKMVMEMTPWTGYPLATASIVTRPITEDVSCPE